MPRRLSFAVILGVLTVALAAPASAITFGELDETNQYANVGALVYQEDDGLYYIYCTGALIEDGDGGTSNLFLTAAHCIPPGEEDGEPTRMWVTFDPTVDLDPETGALTAAQVSTLIGGWAYPHENFACCGANDTYDIAVVLLDVYLSGAAQVAEAGMLSAMSERELRAATFYTAGYGTVRNDKTRGFASFFFDGDRRWAQQSALSLTPSWLTLSMNPSTGNGGTCYGDSGGPHFMQMADGSLVVVSITVTGDVPCRATDKTYRLDTAVAQEFLSRFQ